MRTNKDLKPGDILEMNYGLPLHKVVALGPFPDRIDVWPVDPLDASEWPMQESQSPRIGVPMSWVNRKKFDPNIKKHCI